MITYNVELFDPYGRSIDFPDELVSVDYARSLNTVGASIVRLKLPDDFIDVAKNYIVKIYRINDYGSIRLAGNTHWYVQSVNYNYDQELVEIGSSCPNYLLSKRLVAYTSETTYADKTREEFLIGTYLVDYPEFCIDNMMRQYVRENMSSAALDADRDLGALLEVEADLCLGPQGEKQAGFANLLSTLQDLANMSENLGTPLFFELSPNGSGLFFRVNAGYLNLDRGPTTTEPVIFSEEANMLSNVNLTFDYSEEGNVVYVQGEDSAAAKLYETVVDTDRSTKEPFARREFIYDAGSEASSVEYLQSQGAAALSAHRPRIRLSAKVVDDTGFIYGEDFGYGDRVEAAVHGYKFSCLIRTERASYADHQESLDIALEGERFTP